MRKGVANIMLLALVLFGFSKIATADVCFLPDDEECGNDVPYNEGCENGDCNPTPPTPTPTCVGSNCDPTPPVTCPDGCFDTEEAAISARGRSKTVAGTTFVEDSYYKFNQCWCLTTECSNLEYKHTSELGGNWTCTPCSKPKSKFYNNRYKCSCNITAKNGYTADTTSCQWIPIPCEEGTSTDCTPTSDGCTTCEDTGKKSGELSCTIKHTTDPTCPEGGSVTRPTSGCYNKETQKCGTQTCYIPYSPNCTGNKEQKGTADQCSCVCKTGYHEQGSDCIENACPTNTVKESDCVTTNYTKFHQTSSYTDTSGNTINCGTCKCTPLANETQPNSGCYKQAQDDNGCGEMRIVYLDATPQCGSNAHVTGSGTNCSCACDTGYTINNNICILNGCPTGTMETKDCDTSNTHYSFAQTSSYINTSGNTVKCGKCICTPSQNETLTQDNNCYKLATESNGCGGQRTVYIQYTHTCMLHGHRTGRGTSCDCACDTGYHPEGDLCVLNSCPTNTVEEATCTANAYPNTIFTQTGLYKNTSGNTIKCGTCTCTPTTYTLPQDSYCYQTVPANNGCGGTTTGYQKITPFCGNNTKVIRLDTISGNANCVCECADGFDSLSAGDTHCYTNQECSLSCQATMYKVTPKNPVDDGYKIYNSTCCKINTCDSSYNLTTKPTSATTTYDSCSKGCGLGTVYKCASNYHHNSSNNKCEPDCEVKICTNPVTVPSNAHCTNECTPQTKQCVTSSTVCMAWECDTGYTLKNGNCVLPNVCNESNYEYASPSACDNAHHMGGCITSGNCYVPLCNNIEGYYGYDWVNAQSDNPLVTICNLANGGSLGVQVDDTTHQPKCFYCTGNQPNPPTPPTPTTTCAQINSSYKTSCGEYQITNSTNDQGSDGNCVTCTSRCVMVCKYVARNKVKCSTPYPSACVNKIRAVVVTESSRINLSNQTQICSVTNGCVSYIYSDGTVDGNCDNVIYNADHHGTGTITSKRECNVGDVLNGQAANCTTINGGACLVGRLAYLEDTCNAVDSNGSYVKTEHFCKKNDSSCNQTVGKDPSYYNSTGYYNSSLDGTEYICEFDHK